MDHLAQPSCRSRVTYSRLPRTLSRRVSSLVCQPCIAAEGTDGSFLLGPAGVRGTELLAGVPTAQFPGLGPEEVGSSLLGGGGVRGGPPLCGAPRLCEGGRCPCPLAVTFPPSQGLLCSFCCRWEEVTPKTGCPATPACSTTTSHCRHSPARSPTSAGSKTRTAVRQLRALEAGVPRGPFGSPVRSSPVQQQQPGGRWVLLQGRCFLAASAGRFLP